MKKKCQTLIVLWLITSGSILAAQNISLDELLNLRKKNLVEVEEYLSNKEWIFIEGTEAGFKSLGQAVFAYNKNESSDLAESFIQYIYSAQDDILDIKRINIKMFNNVKYNIFLNRIKSFGCKLISSKIVENTIVKVYRGATITFEIATTARKDELSDSTNTSYYIGIFENLDFQLTFEKD